MSLPLVILTATIDPQGCAYLKRRDPAVRLADYTAALEAWIGTGCPLLLVENSGHPAGQLAALAADHREQVEFLQFSGNDYPRYRGKGYGEMGILRHAVKHSAMIPRHRRVAKVTGRLYVANFAEIAAQPGPRCQRGGRTEVFLCERSFLPLLLAHQEEVDDSRGRYFEHAFRDARRSIPFREMAPEPILRGHSGTFDRPYFAPL